jgi:hypothetical protein
MIEILRRIFKANPGKSTIGLVNKCSVCGRKINIEITSTSGGFGLQGGVLFKHKPDRYLAKCPACHQAKPKIDDKSIADKNKDINR